MSWLSKCLPCFSHKSHASSYSTTAKSTSQSSSASGSSSSSSGSSLSSAKKARNRKLAEQEKKRYILGRGKGSQKEALSTAKQKEIRDADRRLRKLQKKRKSKPGNIIHTKPLSPTLKPRDIFSIKLIDYEIETKHKRYRARDSVKPRLSESASSSGSHSGSTSSSSSWEYFVSTKVESLVKKQQFHSLFRKIAKLDKNDRKTAILTIINTFRTKAAHNHFVENITLETEKNILVAELWTHTRISCKESLKELVKQAENELTSRSSSASGSASSASSSSSASGNTSLESGSSNSASSNTSSS